MRVFRYSRWDGTQTPIADDLSVSKLVDSLSDDILDGLGPDMAFEHMLRRGVPGQFGGIQSMMERLRRARAQQREQGRLDGWLEGLRDQLDRIVDTERAQLARQDDDTARLNESLLDSLPSDRREELMRLSQEMLQDMGLSFEISRLTDSLRDLFPQMPWDQFAGIDGDQPLGLSESLEAIERLAELDDLECTLKMDGPNASLEDVDVDKLRRTLGDDAARDLERMKQVERAFDEAGILARRGGKMEMTPRGIRKLGERALVRVFERLVADRAGSHDVREAGGTGEATGATRQWRWGDPFRIHVQRTVGNAVMH